MGRRIDTRAVRANIIRMKAENPRATVIDSTREAGIYDVSLNTGE